MQHVCRTAPGALRRTRTIKTRREYWMSPATLSKTPPGLIEHIIDGGRPLAYIIRASFQPEKTTFLTPPDFKQQVGYVVYPAEGEVVRHIHKPLERHLVGTSEVLI